MPSITTALVVGGISAAGTVASSVIGAGAASDASQAQVQAANTAANTQLTMYNQTRSDLLGYNQMGGNAFSQLANIFGFGGGGQGQSQGGGYGGYGASGGGGASRGGGGVYGGAGGYNGGGFGAGFDQSIGGVGSGQGGSPNAALDAYLKQNPDVMDAYATDPRIDRRQFPTPESYAQYHYQTYGQNEGRGSPQSDLGNVAPNGGNGPGATGGNSGVPNFTALTSALAQTPGYQFTLDQGTQALDRSAASRGLSLSGAQLKDSQTYGQGLAMASAYQPYIQNLQFAAGLGENAAAQTGNAGASAAQGIASSQLAAGQASAAGSVAQGNIIGSGLSQLGQIARGYGSSYGGNSGGQSFNDAFSPSFLSSLGP